MLTFLVVLIILFAVVALIGAPLREARAPERGSERAELEAAREAKYREIRDAELDRATGKLSEADFQPVDAELRTEAVVILDRLERLGAG